MLLTLTFFSCDNGGDDDDGSNTEIVIDSSLLPTGSGSQAYLLLTNPTYSTDTIPKVTINGSETRTLTRSLSEDSSQPSGLPEYPIRLDPNMPSRDPNRTNNSRAVVPTISYETYSLIDGDDTNDECLFDVWNFDTSSYTEENFILTSRSDITGATDGELFIWVSTVDVASGAIVIHADGITNMENNFDTIYTDMINLFGEPWGTHAYSNLLSTDTEDIHILLTDIEKDENSSTDGVYYGYFDPTNSYTDDANSNQALLFVVDAYGYFKSLDAGAFVTDSYQETVVISTIIHEFQHMIHDYNKAILQQNYTYSTFFTEMFSMVAEDILANTHLVYNSLGTDYVLNPEFGRIPAFNLFWDTYSSFTWDNSLMSYSLSYTMGAYLIRNYGFEVFNKYMEIDSYGEDGILDALNEVYPDSDHTITTLLQDFGKAILLSENEGTFPYNFNNAGTLGDTSYYLYSINFFDTAYNNAYYSYGNDTNRLRSQSYPYGGWVDAQFTPISLTEINAARLYNQMFATSNIYVDLGVISSSDEIAIDYEGLTTNSVYEIVF